MFPVYPVSILLPLYSGSVTFILLILFSISVGASEPDTKVIAATPSTSYSRSVPAGWQGATRRDEAFEKMPRPKSLLTIRVYEDFGALRPYYGNKPAYGIDVTAEIEKCLDDNDRISALNIGGWLYEVDGDCSDDDRRRRVSVSEVSAENGKEKAGEVIMHCDPATWRYRIASDTGK